MKLIKRYTKKTLSFFRKLRNIGIALATAKGIIIAAPISLPAIVVSIATYLTVAGTVVESDNDMDLDEDTNLYKN